MALTDVKSEQIQSSVALAGSPTTTTQSASDNSTKIATTAYVETAVANLVASAPASLNTLDELAAALNDDASFSTTVTNSIAAKLPLAGGTLTGDLIIGAAGTSKVLQVKGTSNQDIFLGTHAYGTSLQAARHPTTGTFSNTGVAAAAINLEVANADSSLTFWTSTTNNVVPTKRMTIDKNGNVGIGVASPSSLLELSSALTSAAGGVTVTNTNAAGYSTLQLRNTGGTAQTYTISVGGSSSAFAQKLYIYDDTDSAARLVIDHGGKIGIGANSPTEKLEVSGSVNATYQSNNFATGVQRGFLDMVDASKHVRIGSLTGAATATGTQGTVEIVVNNSAKVVVDTSGNVGIGVTPSAHHYKTLELGTVGNAITGRSPADMHMLSGMYWDGASTRKYAVSGVAVGTYQITNGSHYWSSPAAGTAGNTATVSANMTLTADGRLGIGTTTPASYDTNSGGISGDLVVANSGHAGIVVASGTGSDAGIFFGDGTGNAAYRGAVSYVNSQDRLYFKANGSNYLTLDNTRLNAMGINLDVGVDTATVNFTDSVSNGNTKYIEIGANGSSSLGDALLVTHSSGSGVGYFGYESGNDRLIIACDNGGGNNSIEFSVNAGTGTGGSTDNLNSAVSALTIHGSKLVTMPYNLFVDAYKSTSQTISGWTKVIYDTKTGTNNAGFNTSSGISRFTAPVAGKYLVSVTCYLATANIPYIYTGIWKNGSAYRYIHGQNSITTGTDWTYGGTIQIYLAQNDYIEHYAYSNGTAALGAGVQRTSFSIYLLG